MFGKQQAASSSKQADAKWAKITTLLWCFGFWWMVPISVKYNRTKFEQDTQEWPPGTSVVYKAAPLRLAEMGSPSERVIE